jgi:hypothetical protein
MTSINAFHDGERAAWLGQAPKTGACFWWLRGFAVGQQAKAAAGH